jgi:hypothetical protein
MSDGEDRHGASSVSLNLRAALAGDVMAGLVWASGLTAIVCSITVGVHLKDNLSSILRAEK